MTVKGYDCEITAYLVRDGGTIKVYVGYVNRDDEHLWASYAYIASSGSISWTTGGSDNVHKMLDGTVYFPVNMAVDNFDNRGTVRYAGLQVTHPSDNPYDYNLAVSVLHNGDVDSYGYGDWIQYTQDAI